MFKICVLKTKFLDQNWPNHATSNHWNTKKIKSIRHFAFFLNFDLAKRGTLAPLASSLVASLTVSESINLLFCNSRVDGS